LHERGLIHKDIKPANVFVDMTAGTVHLTGFGIASMLPREHQEPGPPETIEGTLAYMAPEQTGRMNRSVDSRSDLYSLGVTLYMALTGQLPFVAADPMDWIHCHIARQPRPPVGPVPIPGPISELLLKLMAKAAEDRYQSAAGVEADLRHCLAEWEAYGRIEPFALGTADVSDRLRIPEKLYGRERDIAELLDAFQRVVEHGALELVLVGGYSGIGKSSVVSELHRVIVPPRGLFASGKFDQRQRDIPYAVLAQAFQSLMRQILPRSAAELESWRAEILQAIGTNGRLIVDLVPEIEDLIGRQPAVPELPPQEAKNRFHAVLGRFLAVFAQEQHPLVLFLDDLQWLDAATMQFLEYALTRRDIRHLLLVGAYRENEVGRDHPLQKTLEAIRKTGTIVRELTLAPLSIDDLNHLVADCVHCDRNHSRSLAQIAHEKTGGNPFFAIQFLTELAKENLLSLDRDAGAWTWDIERIRRKGLSNNAADLLVTKLRRLSASTQDAIKQFACLGNIADEDTVIMVLGRPAVDHDLLEAEREGFLVRMNGSYRFTHDRIQEASYATLAQDERAAVHLRIGRIMAARLSQRGLAERLFEVTNQLNAGAALITDTSEMQRLRSLNALSGRKAKAAGAFGAASNYFRQAARLLPQDAWMMDSDEIFSQFLDQAECEYLTACFQACGELLDLLLTHARSNLDRARVQRVRMRMCQFAGQYADAVTAALEALRMLGMVIPEADHDLRAATEEATRSVAARLSGRHIGSILDEPMATDPVASMTINVLAESLSAAYGGQPRYFPLLALRGVEASLRDGNVAASSGPYSCYAIMLVGMGDVSTASAVSELSVHLAERCQDERERGTALLRHGYFVNHWRNHIVGSVVHLEEAFTACCNIGDLLTAGYAALARTFLDLETGATLDQSFATFQRFSHFARQSHNDALNDSIGIARQFIACMKGQTSAPACFDDAEFSEAASLERWPKPAWNHGYFRVLKQAAAFHFAHYAEALEQGSHALDVQSAFAAMPAEASCHFYRALTLAALFETAPVSQQQDFAREITEEARRFERWAEGCPENFTARFRLISAEKARIEQREMAAIEGYEQAIRSAHTHGFVGTEALACELAARFYLQRGLATNAHAHLRQARSCYLQWGARGKTAQLDQLHPFLAEEKADPSLLTSTDTPLDRLDIGTVIGASHAISREIVPSVLTQKLMQLVVKHAGADRGLLIMVRNEEPRIEADAMVRGDRVEVELGPQALTPSDSPISAVRHVLHARESMLVDDARRANPFPADEYLVRRDIRSILCLPLMKQASCIGVLYLENSLVSGTFTSQRVALLEVLAAQAVISLENARLFTELKQENNERQRAEATLREREARIRRLIDANIIGIFIWKLEGRIIDANDAFLRIVGYDRDDVVSGRLSWRAITPPEWLIRHDQQWTPELKQTGSLQPFEKEYFRQDGGRVPVMVGGASFSENGDEGVAFVLDLTERKRAEEALREMQLGLAHANRVATMGQFTATLAHEIGQPIAAMDTNANAALSWLGRDPPDLEGTRESLEQIISDAARAGNIIIGIRNLIKKSAPRNETLDINEAVREVGDLIRAEAIKNGVLLQTRLARGLPLIKADRVQLQQVVLNLVVNAIEAMGIGEGPRELVISTGEVEAGAVTLAVQDSGPGLEMADLERVFDAFYTTKPTGLGMGLSICQSIIKAHGGRLSAARAEPRGAIFQFTIPITREDGSADGLATSTHRPVLSNETVFQ
jgi:PAS domain S-box-containing protein